MLKRLAVVFVLAGAGVLALSAEQAAANHVIRASLNGDKEVGPGDDDGRGTFRAEFRRGRLCYRLRFTGLDDPIAAHIHRGPRNADGPVVVDLRPRFDDDVGARNRCVSVSRALRTAIRRRPGRYYVNVHTEALPEGAIRGQLSRRPH